MSLTSGRTGLSDLAAKLRATVLALTTLICIAATGTAKADSPYFYSGMWGGVPYGYGYLNYFSWPANYWYGPYNVGFSYGFVYPRIPTYGVIAFSATANVGGFAWGQPSLYAASSQAVTYCGAADCRPVVWVQGGCAAISTGAVGNTLGWAYGANKLGAITMANQACLQSGGINCQPRGWVCSF